MFIIGRQEEDLTPLPALLFMSQNLRWTPEDLARVKAKQAANTYTPPKPTITPGYVKYKNKPKEVNGIKFKSTLEANVYEVFINSGLIPERQVKFELIPDIVTSTGKIKGINYYADFVMPVNDQRIVIESKGHLTPHSKDKLKLYANKYGSLPMIIKSKTATHRLVELIKTKQIDQAAHEFATFKNVKKIQSREV